MDITSLTLALPSALLRRTVGQLARAGMVAREREDCFRLKGAGWALSLGEVRGHARLSQIAFAVDEGQAAEARLGTALWSIRATTASVFL